MRSQRKGIYALNNQEKGLFEFAQPILAVKKGDPAQILVKRKGGSKGSASLKLITEPGTGVHGKVYKIPTSLLSSQMARQKKQSKFQPLILQEKRPMSMTLRSNCCIRIKEVWSALFQN